MSRTPNVYIGDVRKRPGVLALWEKQRNRKEIHWLVECFAEALGVFLYTFFGVGSTLGFILGNLTKQAGFSSILQIGFAYGIGILFVFGVAAGTSNGHFNPSITIVSVIFRGFPIPKAIRFILSQIFGGYVACMVVYYQWRPLVKEMVGGLMAAGKEELMFTPNGPPGAFALYRLPEMSFGPIFLNEFICSFIVALVIWAALDPTNIFISPRQAPFYVALAYAGVVWSFALPGIALNTARDLGGRFWAMSIWGTEAAGGRYAAIAALTNIPATIFAVTIYEVFLVDSDRPITPQGLEFVQLAEGNRRLAKHDEPATPDSNTLEKGRNSSQGSGKASVDAYEVAVEARQQK